MIARRALLALFAPVALVACAASPEQGQRPVASASRLDLPAGSTLRQLGFANGPTNVVLPSDLRLERVIDQPNVVTLFFTPEVARTLGPWLSQRLEQMGFTIEADRNGSILFRDEHWRGAFTTPTEGEKATLAGLTLRKQP